MFRSLKLLLVGGMLAVSADRSAVAWNHGCGFGNGYHSTWGAYGMGGGFRTSGFGSCFGPSYSYSGFCSPSVSWSLGFNNYCGPSFVSSFRPTICGPRYYSAGWCPTTCWTPPTFVYRSYSCYPFYVPPVYSSWSYSGCYPTNWYSSYYNVDTCATSSFVSNKLNLLRPTDEAVLPFQAVPGEKPVTAVSTLAAVRRANHAARLQETTQGQESWLVLAVELIDSMAQKGGVGEGLAACEQLINVRPKLSSEIYWRAAVLASLAGRDSKQVARYIELADRTGERFSPSILPGGSLRAYVARIPGQSFDNALNRHARTALTGDRPTEAYQVLAAFLKQDGQSQRAEKFALAAKGLPQPTPTQEKILLTAKEKAAR